MTRKNVLKENENILKFKVNLVSFNDHEFCVSTFSFRVPLLSPDSTY